MAKTPADLFEELRILHLDLCRANSSGSKDLSGLIDRYNRLKEEFEEMGKRRPNVVVSLEERVTSLERSAKLLFTERNRLQAQITILNAKAGIITIPDTRTPPAPTPVVLKPNSPTPLLDSVPAVPFEATA